MSEMDRIKAERDEAFELLQYLLDWGDFYGDTVEPRSRTDEEEAAGIECEFNNMGERAAKLLGRSEFRKFGRMESV